LVSLFEVVSQPRRNLQGLRQHTTHTTLQSPLLAALERLSRPSSDPMDPHRSPVMGDIDFDWDAFYNSPLADTVQGGEVG